MSWAWNHGPQMSPTNLTASASAPVGSAAPSQRGVSPTLLRVNLGSKAWQLEEVQNVLRL